MGERFFGLSVLLLFGHFTNLLAWTDSAGTEDALGGSAYLCGVFEPPRADAVF
ncbi:MAG: hypothetical protein OXB90_10610 [Acidimicrobiaceae bacterium]|nr:hypothetical protein [Acidimicrobiaceae bacterium]